MDLFETWLTKKNESEWVKRALTDKSFNAFKCRGIKNTDPNYDEVIKSESYNTDLATYGDAVIKLCYSELLLDKVDKLTEEKAKLESDEFLVDAVGRHYSILDCIRKDKDNPSLPDSYDYKEHQSKKHNRCKYIATAVEAMIGAIYKETKSLGPIVELLDSWRNLKQ